MAGPRRAAFIWPKGVDEVFILAVISLFERREGTEGTVGVSGVVWEGLVAGEKPSSERSDLLSPSGTDMTPSKTGFSCAVRMIQSVDPRVL